MGLRALPLCCAEVGFRGGAVEEFTASSAATQGINETGKFCCLEAVQENLYVRDTLSHGLPCADVLTGLSFNTSA